MRLLLNPTVMSFDFIVPEMKPSESIQKIAGFSRGHHHKNSIRLGIRKENEYCVLYLYAYINGERISKRICNVFEDVKLWVTLTFGRRYVSVKVQFANGTEYEAWEYFRHRFTFPIGYELYSYAEEDVSGKEIDFYVIINNSIIL